MSEINPYESLKRMKELLDAGILTQEEFNKEKAKILGDSVNPGITDEQRSKLKKIESLRDAGVLNEKEFEEQKKALLSPPPQKTKSESHSHGFNPSPSISARPKQKSGALWIVLGVVAAIVVIALVLGSNSGDYSGASYGLLNSYSEVDNYLDYNYDTSYREGDTVYYRDIEDIPGLEIIGGVIKNPELLSILFGQDGADIGGFISGGIRESVLRYLIREDYRLLQLTASNGLNLCYSLNDVKLFVYTPDEIRGKLSNY